MKKQILAVAIAACTFASQASAVELYNQDGTTFSVGGHVSVNLNGSDEGDTGVGTNSPRINFMATQDLGNGFKVDAKGEFALNFLEGGENAFTTRLGYIGLTHNDFGRVVAGTQWAPFYDVAGVADMPIAFANDFLYENHGTIGTGRANDMISYRNGFELGQAMVNFGLGAQGSNNDVDTGIEYDSRVQATASVSLHGAKLGYAITTGEATSAGTAEDVQSQALSVAYGSYGQGLYLAGVYAQNEFVNADSMGVILEESTGTELLASYGLDNGLTLVANYEMIEGEDAMGTEETMNEDLAIQAEYSVTSNIAVYTGYEFDLTDEDDNRWTIGGRFYL